MGVQTGPRPLVVFISNERTDGAVEHRTFDDSSVRLASRAFRTVRITTDAAKVDPFLAAHARSAPAMVVFSPDMTHADLTSGSALDARTALDAMRKSAKTDLGLDLDAAVTRARALIADEKSVVSQKSGLLRVSPYDAGRAAELDRRLAEIRAELGTVLRPPPPPAR